MREWRLAHKGQFCGGCRRPLEPIPEGTPFLVLTRDDVKLARCPKCAKAMFGEDPPEAIDAPPVAPGPVQQPFAAGRGRKRFDPKLAQLAEGDR